MREHTDEPRPLQQSKPVVGFRWLLLVPLLTMAAVFWVGVCTVVGWFW